MPPGKRAKSKAAAKATGTRKGKHEEDNDQVDEEFEPEPPANNSVTGDDDEEFEHSANNSDEFEYSENIHRRLFLRKAFGINPDGSPIENVEAVNGYPTPEYNSVKTVETYNRIVSVLENWGDDAFVKANPDHPEAKEYLRFRLRSKEYGGYNFKRDFILETNEDSDGNPKKVLIKRKGNKIVLHMLDMFDAIKQAHGHAGHLKGERTLQQMRPHYYSCTMELCNLWVSDCPVCHTKNDPKPKRKGASKPIISSEFRDRTQVDLIDMRTVRKRDVYGNMQRWIMTVKDHSTGLIYLVALPRKMAKYVAAELEKYFGLVGYPHIFHTGACTISYHMSYRVSVSPSDLRLPL